MGKPFDFTFYNPDQLDDEIFLTGFVARQALVTKILARLGDIKPRRLAQHRLIVGQRGMGKTSLLRRIALGVRDEPALAAMLLPLSFREEQYNVHNLHVFWCNCLDALGDWLESAGRGEDARRLDRDVVALNSQDDDEEGSRALTLFKQWMKEEQKRPLLLLDNIDIIFAGLKTKQWSLRRVLQEAGGIVVIGASAAALEAAADREAAFYDFFQVDVLSKLEHHEVLLCLRHMAQQREEAGRRVLRILDRDPARIHVLYDLTGGNPRTLAFLYLVLETGGDDDVMRDLERLLDQATPLYKARVEELAPQTRVVFDALALAWDPATAASLADIAGLEVGVVSTHLDRLLKDGVIEKTSLSSTRRTAYQIAERFFNIWYLMRHSSRRQRLRLRWLTEMLRRIYTPRELRERATGLLGGAESQRLSSAAYCLALSDALDDRELRIALRRSACRHPSFAVEGDALTEDDLHLPTAATEPVNTGAATATYRKAIESNPRDPGLWYGLGRLLFDISESHDEAEAAFRKATEIDPQNVQAWVGLGRLLRDPLGRHAEAEEAYRKAIDIDPKYAPAWYNLGFLLEVPPGRHVEAEDAYRKVIEIDPQDAWAWYSLANLLADPPRGRHAEAEEAYRKAIEIDPQNAWAWNNLGVLLKNSLGRHAEAESAYHKSIEIDPQNAPPWYNLGNLLAGPLARHAEAEDAYRQFIEIDPQNAGAWYNLGFLLAGPLARHAESEDAYRKAVEIDPQNAWMWLDLGDLQAGPLGRHAEAEDTYRKTIELDPQNAWAWIGLGNLLAGPLARHAEAEDAYRKAIEIDPQYARAWNNLGNLLAGLPGRHAEADDAYRKAIEIDPQNAWIWLDLGDLQAGPLGRHAEAEDTYRKTIEVDPQNAWAWIGLGNLLAGPLARHAEAEDIYRKAIEIDPQNAWAWINRGDLLTRPLARHAEAEDAYRRAVEIDPQDAWTWIRLGYLLADHLFRTGEAEKAYRTALTLDPQNTLALANLTYLLIRRDGTRPAEEVYRNALAGLPPHGAGLLRAFHALAADNFGTATEELRAVLEEGHPDLFTTFRDDLLRNLQFAAEGGNGDKLLAWLESSGFSERYRPLYVAFDAYLHGEDRLMDVNPEVRSGARYLLAEMTLRSSEPAQPEPVKKPRKGRAPQNRRRSG